MILVAAAVSSLFLAAAVLAATFVLLKHQSVAVLRKLPGPKPNFLFGNALQLARLPDELIKQILGFTRQFQKEGLICIWLGPVYPLTLLFKPEYAEILLSTSKHMGKSFDYSFLHPWLGTGLLTSDGSKWKTRRRLITPTFHFRILNDFIQVFEEQAAILVKHLEKEANKGVFNIMPYITLCALDVICITSMDASPNAQEDVDSPYVNAVLRVSELIQMRQRSPWLWNDTLYGLLPSGREHKRCLKILHDFTNEVIDQRIAERASIKSKTQEEKIKEEVDEDDGLYKRKKRLAFLDLLLESYDTGDISREGVREEVDTFMFEGHDTTAAGITWALYLLGRHPVIQQKVHDEVDSFFEQRPETLTVDDLKDLRYLECVIKEALRLFPSVPFFARTTTEDFHMDGYTAPKGTSVGIATLALHRNSDVWPAPLEFNPDRFLPENSQGRHPFAYIPFSAGPRNCIGQRFAFLEEKIVLYHVMRNFSIESAQTFDDLRTCGELITRPKEGIFVTLAKRF
ncbi:cytochrome P450 4V2-like [Porites lutea]|uniref:cytochrome P450 4V2-like n=1 Tax=Porites lutea TaxID=51062 RepID=UPI003CC6C913